MGDIIRPGHDDGGVVVEGPALRTLAHEGSSGIRPSIESSTRGLSARIRKSGIWSSLASRICSAGPPPAASPCWQMIRRGIRGLAGFHPGIRLSGISSVSPRCRVERSWADRRGESAGRIHRNRSGPACIADSCHRGLYDCYRRHQREAALEDQLRHIQKLESIG